MFEIETKEICDFLTAKYAKIAMGLERVIANRVVKSTVEQLQMFTDIENKIKKVTHTIEEASELKDYLDGPVALEVEKIRAEIVKNAEVYTLLEEYKYKFEPKEIENRWVIYKKPRDIYDMVSERLEKIEREKKKYEEEMYQEQEDFKKTFQTT